MLSCRVSIWPFLYLVLPLEGKPKAIGFQGPVTVESRGGWMGRKRPFFFEGKGNLNLVMYDSQSYMATYFLSLQHPNIDSIEDLENAMGLPLLWS